MSEGIPVQVNHKLFAVFELKRPLQQGIGSILISLANPAASCGVSARMLVHNYLIFR